MAGKRKVRVHKPCYECGGNTYKQGGDWIQKATDSIERRGTEGRCTGSNFGGPDCPPGSKQYNLAQTFRKMSKKKKGGSSALQNDNIDKIGEDKINVFKNFLAENTTNTMVEETLIDGPMPTGGMETTFNDGGQNNFGFNANPEYMDDYIARVNELNQLNLERANAFRTGLENTDFNKRLKMKTKLTKAGKDWYRNNYGQFGGAFAHGGSMPHYEWAGEIPDFADDAEAKDWVNRIYPLGSLGRMEAIKAVAAKRYGASAPGAAGSAQIQGSNGQMIDVTPEQFEEYMNNDNYGNPELGYEEPPFLQNGNLAPTKQVDQVLADQQQQKKQDQQNAGTTQKTEETDADDETALNKVEKAVNKTKGNVDVKTLKGEQEADASTEKEKQELAYFTARTPGLFGGKETFAYNPNLTGMSEMNFRRAMLPGNRLKNIKFAHYGPGQQPNVQNTQRQNPNANTTSQQQWDPNAPDFDWERAAMFANRFNTGKERAPVPDAMPRKNDVQIPVTKPTPGQIPANKMRPVAPMPDTNTNAEGMAMKPTPQLPMQRPQPNGVQGPYGQVNSLEDLQYQKDLQAGRVGSASADESGGYAYGGIPNNLPKAEMGNLGKALLIGTGIAAAPVVAGVGAAGIGALGARKGMKHAQKRMGQAQQIGQQGQQMFGQVQGMANPMNMMGGMMGGQQQPQQPQQPIMNQYGGVPFQEAFPQAVQYPIEEYAFGGAGKERRQARRAERQEKRADRKALRPWNFGDTVFDKSIEHAQQFGDANMQYLNAHQGMNPMNMMGNMTGAPTGAPTSGHPRDRPNDPHWGNNKVSLGPNYGQGPADPAPQDQTKKQGFDPSAIMGMFGGDYFGNGGGYTGGGSSQTVETPEQAQARAAAEAQALANSNASREGLASVIPMANVFQPIQKQIESLAGTNMLTNPGATMQMQIAGNRAAQEYAPQTVQYGGMPKMQFAGQPLAETTVRQGYDAGQFQPIISGTMDKLAQVGTAMTEGDAEQDMMNLTSAENVFTPNTNPNKGTTTFNPVGVDSAPDQYTPVQFGAYGGQFKKGGSYTMSDNEIKQFLAAGGQIEYLD